MIDANIGYIFVGALMVLGALWSTFGLFIVGTMAFDAIEKRRDDAVLMERLDKIGSDDKC